MQFALAARCTYLEGPVTREMVLPNCLDWSPESHAFDLSTPQRVKSLYSFVLREAMTPKNLSYLNWGLLVTVWPHLRIPRPRPRHVGGHLSQVRREPGVMGSTNKTPGQRSKKVHYPTIVGMLHLRWSIPTMGYKNTARAYTPCVWTRAVISASLASRNAKLGSFP